MRKVIHALSDKDVDNMTAVCKNCGPVKLVLKAGVYRCEIGTKRHKGHWTNGIGYMSANNREKMIASQSGKCLICSKVRPLARDHDHKTNKDRGFLCSKCNKGLGHFEDNPELLESAAAYLRWHNTEFAPAQKDVTISV